MPPAFEIRRLNPDDADAVANFLREHWGSQMIASRGRLHDGAALPGFVAFQTEGIIGLVIFRIDAAECEVISLDSMLEGRGLGTELLSRVVSEAREQRCRRICLITSNDNLKAMRFYQKRGWRLIAVHIDAINRARTLKPSIPLTGLDGIPITDEIEFELKLQENSSNG